MTIRDHLRSRKRAFLMCAVVGFALFLGFGILGRPLLLPNGIALVILFGCIILYLVGMFGMAYVVRCPRCQGNIGSSYLPLRKWPLSMKPINFCPFCGVSLDEAM